MRALTFFTLYMKYLYIDESIGEQLFVVGGILADSEEDLLFAYRQLKKQISRIPMTRKQKESVMNEFKSVILERTYPQIKRRLLYKINSFRCTVVYASRHYEGTLYQEEKEKLYISMLAQIVSSIEEPVIIVTFDSFGNVVLETRIVDIVGSLPNVHSIKSDFSYNSKGLQFADNVCGVIRKHITGNDNDGFFEIIRKKTWEIK